MKRNITSQQIANEVKNIIEDYYMHPKEFERIKRELEKYFSSECYAIWRKVLIVEDFNVTFKRVLGSKRLKTLQTFLLEIDATHYKDVNFK